MRRLAFLILLLLCAAPLCADATEDQVSDLIARLGSEQWELRERAQRELVGLGEPARKQLVEALEHKDLEIRTRASGALIAIGESFSHAVECAGSKSDGLRDHGLAALANLFRIDDPQNLRALSPAEMQGRYSTNADIRMTQPPALAIARMESITGIRLFVAPSASEAWARVLALPSIDIRLNGDPRQALYVKAAMDNAVRLAAGQDASGAAVTFTPMRIGRATFLYVQKTGENQSGEAGRRVGEQLIAALLGEGPPAVRAAALLAEGASTDFTAADRIRAEFLKDPSALRLMWLTLALGSDEQVSEAVRKIDPAPVTALLDCTDWAALTLAAKFLDCLPLPAKGALLAPLILENKHTLAVTVALWAARGCDLPPASRNRAALLLASREDALAASAVRWFAGAGALTDSELEAVWKAAENQTSESAFFVATLELIGRPDVSEKLVDRARAALSGVQETQQALAAAVLTGRASSADLSIALDKLTRKNNPNLTQRLAGMFVGCTQLDDEAKAKLVKGLVHTDAAVRREFLGALRLCGPDIKAAVVTLWAEAVDKAFEGKEEAKVARQFVPSRVSLWAFQSMGGDAPALERLMEYITGADAEKARLAGGALPDAMAEDILLKELDALRARQGAVHAMMVSAECYLEFARRAVTGADRAAFRKYFGLAITLQYQNNYTVRNELQQLQMRLNRLPDSNAKQESLPSGPVLNKLDIE
ncbi:MAG: hypothetical protein IPP14_02120 [Planctomycetes bacterium]|nr:hypothetical protein [Planctomycetota bacterium]